jgi:hypothetical protein
MTPPQRVRQGRWYRDPTKAKLVPLDAIKEGKAILALLDQTLFLTSQQIAHRFFTVPIHGERKPETELARAARAANRSLSRLKDRGWVRLSPVYTLPAPGKLRTLEVNSLTPPGVEVVRRLYQEAWKSTEVITYSTGQVNPVPETINHDLAVRDALVFLTRLFLDAGIPIHWFTFQTRQLVNEKQTAMHHAPDLIMIVGERRVPLLIEADLGTESIESTVGNSWATKYQQYGNYLKRDFGNDPLFEGCVKPLVVTLTTSDRRLTNLVGAIKGWGGQRSWWCSTFEALSPLIYQEPGLVWWVPTVDRVMSLSDAIRPTGGL